MQRDIPFFKENPQNYHPQSRISSSSTSSERLPTPTSHSSSDQEGKSISISLNLSRPIKPKSHTRSLALPPSAVPDLEDITYILHSDPNSPTHMGPQSAPVRQPIQLFNPIPSNSRVVCQSPPLGNWILKTYWHVETYPRGSAISRIQKDLYAGATQRLIIEIDKALSSHLNSQNFKGRSRLSLRFWTPTMSTSHVPLNDTVQRINLHLLRCASLLACGQAGLGLQDAEKALDIAENEKVYYLRCKSHLYRGLCFRKLARWTEASSAFTKASNIRAWALRVRELKSEAEENIVQLGEKRPKKVTFAE